MAETNNHYETVSLPLGDWSPSEWQQPAGGDAPGEDKYFRSPYEIDVTAVPVSTSAVVGRFLPVSDPLWPYQFTHEPNQNPPTYIDWNPDYYHIPTYGPSFDWWHTKDLNNWWNQQISVIDFSDAPFKKLVCKICDIQKQIPVCPATWDGEWKAI